MCNTREEAEAAVKAAKYPPEGIRSVGGQLHCICLGTDPATYYATANDEILVVVQCESPQGVSNIDAIASVPGVDGIFIGPNDMLKQMLKVPSLDSTDPEFLANCQKVLEACEKYKIAAGIHTSGYNPCNKRMANGFRFMAVASEAKFLVAGAQVEANGLVIPGREIKQAGAETLRY